MIRLAGAFALELGCDISRYERDGDVLGSEVKLFYERCKGFIKIDQ